MSVKKFYVGKYALLPCFFTDRTNTTIFEKLSRKKIRGEVAQRGVKSKCSSTFDCTGPKNTETSNSKTMRGEEGSARTKIRNTFPQNLLREKNSGTKYNLVALISGPFS